MERKELERGITAGPQLDEHEIRRLPHQGFTKLVDIRDDTTNGIHFPLEETRRVAHQVGLRYTHIPMDWRHFDPDTADRFRDALHDEGPIYVQSRRGDLAGALLIMDRAIKKAQDPKAAIRSAEALGLIRAGTRADDYMAAYVAERVQGRVQR